MKIKAQLFMILLIFFTYKYDLAYGENTTCRIAVIANCRPDLEHSFDNGSAPGFVLSDRIDFRWPDSKENQPIKASYLDESDLEGAGPKCKNSEQKYPPVKPFTLTSNNIQQLLFYERRPGSHMFFKLVDISKVKDKSWKNILPTSEGGNNQNIIAQSQSVGGNVSGIEEIMKSVSGCDPSTGALTYYQTQPVKPQVAEAQLLDSGLVDDNLIGAYIAACGKMSSPAAKTNCLANTPQNTKSKAR